MKVETIEKKSCNFREKMKKKLKKINIPGVRFDSSGTLEKILKSKIK